jgi:hypothetical protein
MPLAVRAQYAPCSTVCRWSLNERAVRGEHAELVAFGIGEDHPTSVPWLADVHASCAECNEAVHLSVSVVGIQIDVQPVLDPLVAGYVHEAQAWIAVLVGPDDYLVVGFVQDRLAEGSRPEVVVWIAPACLETTSLDCLPLF